MAPYSNPDQNRGLTAIDAVTALLVILLVIQIWLLSATLDTFLAGRMETALPAAIASGLLSATCFALYRFVRRVDRDVRAGR
jgi:predicted Co/Zn/Cd cation transporter (cation efflux family)